jgi:phosphatidylglycerophosphate synthase
MKKRASGKLVPEKYENPIDNLFMKLAAFVLPLFNTLKIGPNGITTFSFILVFPLIYFYDIYNNFVAIFFLLLLYLFDTVEEYQAKKYNLETDVVDYYDHFKDILVFFVIDIFILMRIYHLESTELFTILFVITSFLFVMMQA